MAIEDDVISSLEEKIKQVIQVAEALKMNNERLQQQVDGLSAQLHTKDQEIAVLESKYQSLKLAKALTASPEDVRNMKVQVNRMIREVDKCMALLNR